MVLSSRGLWAGLPDSQAYSSNCWEPGAYGSKLSKPEIYGPTCSRQRCVALAWLWQCPTLELQPWVAVLSWQPSVFQRFMTLHSSSLPPVSWLLADIGWNSDLEGAWAVLGSCVSKEGIGLRHTDGAEAEPFRVSPLLGERASQRNTFKQLRYPKGQGFKVTALLPNFHRKNFLVCTNSIAWSSTYNLMCPISISILNLYPRVYIWYHNGLRDTLWLSLWFPVAGFSGSCQGVSSFPLCTLIFPLC